MAGQPKAPFYIAVFLVVAALVAFAGWRMLNQGQVANNPPPKGVNEPPKKNGGTTSAGTNVAAGGGAEAADTAGITTVKEFTRKASAPLPAVKGTSAYKPMQNNTVRFALNVWAGWAPIIFANNGFKPDKVWKTPDGQDF